MKELANVTFNPLRCQRELNAFGRLLRRPSLSERRDILPFFRKRRQLSAFIGTFIPDIGPAPLLAHEFPFFGDFSADLVLGSRESKRFCVIEFEDGRPSSIFRKVGKKATTEWSPRFEHGFSQLVDWFYSLDDNKKTNGFKKRFGHNHIKFFGMVIVGRNAGVSDHDRTRLGWRVEKVSVDSHPIECLTFDDLYAYLSRRMSLYTGAYKLERV
jgi:hypothetical protein